MNRHYCEHYDWNDENVERIESEGKIVEGESENYLGKVCANDRAVEREGLSNVNRQLSSYVENQIISGIRFDDCYDSNNDAGDPEHLIPQLVSASEILVEHVHHRKQDHGV